MKTQKILIAGLATATLIGLSGCGSSGDSSKTAAAPKASATNSSTSGKSPSASAMITIKDFAFQAPSSVKAGAKVMVMNADTETHSVTSDQSGLFDVNVDASGGTATLTAPTKPGSYPYHCKYHSNMHGTLVVK